MTRNMSCLFFIWSALVFVSGIVAIGGPTVAAQSMSFEPTGNYSTQSVVGWTVLIGPRVTRDKTLSLHVQNALRSDLERIDATLPPPAVAKLKLVKIWIDRNDVIPSGVGYHNAFPESNPAFNPDKIHGVEISNPEQYLRYTLGQSNVLLHELAHAYHEQFVSGGFANAEVDAAYQNAMENQLYDSVLSAEAGERKAYAATDAREYFAASTQSFFATNDFYPFVRAELRVHDPKMFEIVKKLWGGEPMVVTSSGNKLKLTVVNESNAAALIFWASGDNGDILNHEVKAHESYVITTFLGHRWGAWFFPSERKEQFTMPGQDATWVIGK